MTITIFNHECSISVKKGEMKNIEHIPTSEFDIFFLNYIEIRKRDGSQYDFVKASIKNNSKIMTVNALYMVGYFL